GERGKLDGLAAEADRRSGGQISRALKSAKFDGKRDQMLDIVAPSGNRFDRLLVAGLGEQRKLVARELELLGGAIAGVLQAGKSRTAAVAAQFPVGMPIGAVEAAPRVASGTRLGVYSCDKYKPKKPEPPSLDTVTIMADAPDKAKK